MKQKAIFTTILFLLAVFTFTPNAGAQKNDITCNVVLFEVEFYKGRDNEYIEQYAKSYKSRIESALKTQNNNLKGGKMNFVNTTNWTKEEKASLQIILEQLKSAYSKNEKDGVWMAFKSIKSLQSPEFLEALQLIYENKGLEEITIQLIQGHAFNKPNKKTGVYENDANGYLTILNYSVNAATGQVYSSLISTFPQRKTGEISYQPKKKLTDGLLNKEMKKFARYWKMTQKSGYGLREKEQKKIEAAKAKK